MKKIKIEMKWTLIFIFFTFLWMYFEIFIGLHDEYLSEHVVYSNLFFIVGVTIYFFALKDKKHKYYEGEITYIESLTTGLLITLFLAILAPITQYVISFYIAPDYFEKVARYSLEVGLFKTYEEAISFFNYNNYTIQRMLTALFMGGLTSAVLSIFIRNR